ncbi:MAG: hypothetical protein HXS46_16255 [Theionarchaea archaeon]|nr:MAG: hypothetical protein AYK18_04195 [Theionarchaea archaeon DG-70]MBU7012236.1 hypothetical protein [Theionarchaea archaeon]
MKEERRLSLAEELGMLIDRMKEVEKEDFIQSYMFLIRKEGLEEVEEELHWEVTSTAVASAEISILIDYLLDLNLLEYSSNPGYVLTEEGRRILLEDIPTDLRDTYSACYEKVAALGNNEKITRKARTELLNEKLG